MSLNSYKFKSWIIKDIKHDIDFMFLNMLSVRYAE